MTYRERLAHLRTRLAMLRTSHFMLGAGCACGLPAGHIDSSSIDSTIASHLSEKYWDAHRECLSALFENSFGEDRLSTIICTLLDGAAPLNDADYATLCEDLEAAVGSLEELTGGKSRRSSRFESL